MEDKVFERFLKGMNITNLEDYDMSFDLCEWSPIKINNEKILTMVIRKETPWNYELLRKFLGSLKNITTYKYTIHYTYDLNPNAEDVYHLLTDWYFANFGIAFLEDYKFDEKKLIIQVDDIVSVTNKLKGFVDLLDVINYDDAFEITNKSIQSEETILEETETIDDDDDEEEIDEDEAYRLEMERRNQER